MQFNGHFQAVPARPRLPIRLSLTNSCELYILVHSSYSSSPYSSSSLLDSATTSTRYRRGPPSYIGRRHISPWENECISRMQKMRKKRKKDGYISIVQFFVQFLSNEDKENNNNKNKMASFLFWGTPKAEPNVLGFQL